MLEPWEMLMPRDLQPSSCSRTIQKNTSNHPKKTDKWRRDHSLLRERTYTSKCDWMSLSETESNWMKRKDAQKLSTLVCCLDQSISSRYHVNYQSFSFPDFLLLLRHKTRAWQKKFGYIWWVLNRSSFTYPKYIKTTSEEKVVELKLWFGSVLRGREAENEKSEAKHSRL